MFMFNLAVTEFCGGLRLWRAQLPGGRVEVGNLFEECRAAGQMDPTLLHVEPKLLPGEILSLIGFPPTLSGKLTAFENFVAEIAASCQSEQTSTISPSIVKSAPKREGPEEVNRPGPTALARFFEGFESRPPLLRTNGRAGSKASVITL
jgi:hypothetical protein